MTKTIVGIEAMDYMSQLTIEKVFDYYADLKTVDEIVDDLLGFQVQSPAITKGTIAASYSILERSLEVISGSILQALLELRAIVGGYLEVDDNRQLNWIESIGEDKGQQIRYRKNLVGISRDVDYTQLVNRLYMFGAGERGVRVRLGDGGFAYIAGSLIRKVWKVSKLDLVKDSESANYGGDIFALAEDEEYVYVGGAMGMVWKLQKTNMGYVTESPAYGGAIQALAGEDVGYIYAAGAARRVTKYLKYNMAYTSQSADYGSSIVTLTEDEEYVYAGGTTGTVWKIRKSDMFKVAESANYGSPIYELAEDDDYVYAGGNGGTVWKIQKSDMSKVAESANYGSDIFALAADDEYVYAGGTGTIKKLLKSDISEVTESVETDIWFSFTAKVDSYLYACSLGDRIYKFWKFDLAKVGDELDYGGDVQTVVVEPPFEDYLDDAYSQATWGGIYPSSISDDLILDADTLMERAIYELAQLGDPPIAYQISTIDLSAHEGYNFEALRLGSLVTVIDEDLGIDVAVYVSKITHPDLLNPQRMEIELSVLTKDIIDTMLEMSGAALVGVSAGGGGVSYPAHASTHEAGGKDEIIVTGLDGLLTDMQHPHMDDFDWGIIFDYTNWEEFKAGSGSTLRGFRKVSASTGAVANSWATAYANWLPDINWDRNMSFYFAFRPSQLGANTNGFFHMGQLIVGLNPAASTIGFKVIGDALYGLIHDGANLYVIDLGITLVSMQYYFLEVRLTAGSSVKWFMDGAEKASENHYPTGSAARTLVVSVKNPGTVNQTTMFIARWGYKIGWG